MGANLIDTARGLITPEMLDKAAASTGEATESTKKALHGALPAIFAAFAHRSSTPEGASAVFAAITQSGLSGAIGRLIGGVEGPEHGRGLMGAIFGERGASVSEALAKSSGIKGSSAARILEFATPLVAGMLGKEVLSRKMGAGELSQMLSAHKQAIADDPSTPAGLSDALGPAPVSAPTTAPVQQTETRAPAAAEGSSRLREVEQRARDVEQKVERGARDVGLKIERGAREVGHRVERGAYDVEQRAAATVQRSPWKVALSLVAAGLAVWGIVMATRGHAPPTGVTAAQPSAPSMPTLEAPPAPTIPPAPALPAPPAGITLPGGGTLDVAPNSSEGQFAHALGDNAVLLPRVFSFDDLTFAPGSSTLGPDANKTLDALATTLKAYPSASVRVEGYAGKGGSLAANRALSQSRAREVKDMLVSRGVAPEQIHTTGRGARAAVAKRTEVVLIHR
jgi:outer membrane protein OmpA-like peptidoglycan-associated protein